jgi:hypothetical protein
MPRKPTHSQIPEFEIFDTPELKEKWGDWITYRQENGKKPYVPSSLKGAFSELRKLATGKQETMIDIIQQSINCQWEGFWPLKEKNINGNKQSTSNGSQRSGTSASRIDALRGLQ